MPVDGAQAKFAALARDHKRQDSLANNQEGSQSTNKLHSSSKLQFSQRLQSHRITDDNYWRILQNRSNKRNDKGGSAKNLQMDTNFWKRERDSNKVRFITDLRAFNKCHGIQRHHPQTWGQLLESLNNKKLQWGITMDLKGYFHHLQLHPATQRWMRFWYGNKGYQILAMPFGWSLSPFWSHRFAQPIRHQLHRMNIIHSWWVDDLLVLGETPEEVTEKALKVINLLTRLGIQINSEKTMREPSQRLVYLGHQLDLKSGMVVHMAEKTQAILKYTIRQLKSKVCTPRWLAALAGMTLDAVKSNTALLGLPQQLMKAAAIGVAQGRKMSPHLTTQQLWSRSIPKSAIPQLQSLLHQILQALQAPVSRPFRSQKECQYTLQVDSSDQAWGASLMHKGKEVTALSQKWDSQTLKRHITFKEALASAKAVQQLLPLIPPFSQVNLQSDAMATVIAWRKGSKLGHMNHHIKQQLCACHSKGIYITSTHIPGTLNQREDSLSRHTKCTEFQLKPHLFQEMCRKMNYWPEVDLFAKRWNRQTQEYCSRETDPRSRGNAFLLNWGLQKNWMNPPLNLVPVCLSKLQQEKATALVCLPVWQSAPWWPKVLNMMEGQPQVVQPGQAIHQDKEGKNMPAQRWETLFCTLNGARLG